MKKYDGILKRVDEKLYKNGVKYTKTDSATYKTFNILFAVSSAYGLFMCIMFVLSICMRLPDAYERDLMLFYLVAVAAFSALLIAGFVINCFKKHLAAFIVSGVSLAALIVVVAFYYRTPEGILGLDKMYYTRFLIPLGLGFIFLICEKVIALKENKIINREYKKIVEELYAFYSKSENPTEEYGNWEDFLKGYDFEKYKEILSEGKNV